MSCFNDKARNFKEFPLWLCGLRTLQSVHENGVSIPGLVRWIKDPLFFFFLVFRASLEAYGGPQARGQIGDTAASLQHIAAAMRAMSGVCELHHNSRQCGILNPLREPRDWTCNLMVPGWICFCCAMTGTPGSTFFFVRKKMKARNFKMIGALTSRYIPSFPHHFFPLIMTSIDHTEEKSVTGQWVTECE